MTAPTSNEFSTQGDAAGAPRLDDSRWGGVRRGRWAQLFLIFTLVGLVSATPMFLQSLASDGDVQYHVLVSELVGWYMWALFVPLVVWVVRRFPLERGTWWPRVALYLVIGVAASLAYAVLAIGKRWLLVALISGREQAAIKAAASLRDGTGTLLWGLEIYLLVFAAILAVVHAFEYNRRYRDRELATSRLTAQLSAAQLQVLRSQLNPHFLFNSLNAISALMHRNVDAADRMLVLLSDFLRMTLEMDDEQEIPLDMELEMLELYVEIERTRFGERLEVDIDIDSEVRDALVPSMVLQPLVENAIRHGVSMRSAPGRVEVQARPEFPDRLELRVRDDGPGLKADVATLLRPGVGLHNTRARLEQLYGEDQRFEIGNARDGGFQITLSFPLKRTASEVSEAALEGDPGVRSRGASGGGASPSGLAAEGGESGA